MITQEVEVVRFKSKYEIPFGHSERVLTEQVSGMRTTRPVVQKEKCAQCGWCYLYCPTGSVTIIGGAYFEAQLEFCKGCGICAKECPTNAIVMVEEDER